LVEDAGYEAAFSTESRKVRTSDKNNYLSLPRIEAPVTSLRGSEVLEKLGGVQKVLQ